MPTTVFAKALRTAAILLSFLVLLISLGALLSSRLNPGPTVLTLCGLSLPFTLIISLILLVLWLLARSFWALLPLATLLLSYPFIASVMRPMGNQPLPPNKAAVSVSLCSYNIQGVSYGQSDLTLRLLTDFVQKERIDILCLQEMDEGVKSYTDSLMASRTGLRYSATAKGSQPSFALSVYSRYPLTNAVDIRFEQSGNHALHTDVIIHGDTLRLFNIHLQTTHFNQHKHGLGMDDVVWNLGNQKGKANQLFHSLQANTVKRNNQALALTDAIRLSPYPVLACGDFNTHPASYTYTVFERVLSDGFRTAGKGYEYTYRYLGNLLRIDYIFHDMSLLGLSYRSHELDFSDHKAVVFRLSPGEPAE